MTSRGSHQAHTPQMPHNIELPLAGVDQTTAAGRDTGSLRVQIIRFGITGGLSALVDYGLLQALTLLVGWGHSPAKALSFVAGTTTAYLINRRWTFKAEASGKRFLAVAALYGLTFLLQWGIFNLLHTVLIEHLSQSWTNTVGFVIAQGVATVVNFIAQRTLIFKS